MHRNWCRPSNRFCPASRRAAALRATPRQSSAKELANAARTAVVLVLGAAALPFRHYCYHDIVRHRLVNRSLKIRHLLRLVIRRSIGGIQVWMRGETHPGLMDSLVALASQPVEISGRNWMMRRAYGKQGDQARSRWKYDKRPTPWIYSTTMEAMMTEDVLRIQVKAKLVRGRSRMKPMTSFTF